MEVENVIRLTFIPIHPKSHDINETSLASSLRLLHLCDINHHSAKRSCYQIFYQTLLTLFITSLFNILKIAIISSTNFLGLAARLIVRCSLRIGVTPLARRGKKIIKAMTSSSLVINLNSYCRLLSYRRLFLTVDYFFLPIASSSSIVALLSVFLVSVKHTQLQNWRKATKVQITSYVAL